MRILRGLARLAHKRFQFFDPTRQRLDQRRLLTDDPILVGFAQKREWGTIHPKIDSETKPLRKPIFANHVSSYLLAGPWRGCSPRRTPPVYPFDEHRQLSGGEVRHARLGRGPREVALFQHLVKQAKALTVPPQQLDPVGPPAPEPEDRTRPRRFPDSAFNQRRQHVDPPAHVGHAAGEIDRDRPAHSPAARSRRFHADDQ
jgi:hypothetical protein